ncbi:MAG: sulfite exporter TauE/SafE family protein [Acidimicrobiales bacterium]
MTAPAVSPSLRSATWRLVGVGLAAGLASGLFGVGGGVIIVPALVAFAGFDQRLAHGTSLTAILPISVASTIGYGMAGEVAWGPVIPIAVGAVAGALVGSHLLARLPLSTLRIGFSVVLFLSAVRMVVSVPSGAGPGAMALVDVAGFVLLGLASGVLAGVMGVGGGIIMVPILTFLAGFPLVLAKGTSLAVIIPTSIVATLRNRSAGTTAIGPGFVVGFTGVASGFAGSQLALVLDTRVAATLFAVLLAFVSVQLARTAWVAAKAARSSEPLDGATHSDDERHERA